MITKKEKQNTDEEIYHILHPFVKQWFQNKFKTFAIPQRFAVIDIHSRENILVSAPTGAGKCITADSTILLNINDEARLITGKELIELAKTGKLLTEVDDSGKLYHLNSLQSYSIINNEIKRTKALAYFENYKGKVYSIKTECGRDIRLKKKTRNFSNFKKLTAKELYEIKTLIKTSFSKISEELDVNITTAFRLLNKSSNYKKNELFTLFRIKCKKIKFEKNRIIAKNKGRNTFSFIYPEKINVKLIRWLAFVLAEGLIGDYRTGTHLLVSQTTRVKLLYEFLDNTEEIFNIKFKKRSYKDYVINSTLFC